MKTVQRAAAIFTAAISVMATALALFGAGVATLFMEMFRAFGLGGGGSGGSFYPLGAGVFVVYAFGFALGLAALRWPIASGIALLPLGACALLFGGPIAQVYGIVIMCAGGLLLATNSRRGKT